MKKLLVSMLLVSGTASASQVYYLVPRDVHIDMYKNQHVYDPYLAPVDADLGHGMAFVTNFDMIKWRGIGMYSHNKLHFDQSRSAGTIKHAGWEYELGLSLLPYHNQWFNAGDQDKPGKIEVFWQHHSRHIFEEGRPEHFPVYDRYGVRFRIYP